MIFFPSFLQVGNNPAFIDTLDYIFLSREWEVNDVLPLPMREVVAGPLPNEQEPSDHLLISATLTLPTRPSSSNESGEQ